MVAERVGGLEAAVSFDLEKLKALRDDLNAQDCAVAKTVLELEDELHKLRLGVPIWTKFGDDQKLVYKKINKKWQLVIENADKSFTVLLSASRKMRSEALLLIPNLLEDAVTQMHAHIDERNRVIAVVKETIAGISAFNERES